MKRRVPANSGGYGYIALLALLAVTGLAAAMSLQAGAQFQRHAAEQTLLEIGADFRRALDSYRAATPVGQRASPTTLQELLRDPRYPSVRRHLRKLPVDPVTGSHDWGIVKGPDGGIAAVYCHSDAKPIKTVNFDPGWQALEGKTRYRDWKFTATQPTVTCRAGTTEQHYNAACTPVSIPLIPPSMPASPPSTSSATAKPATASTVR